MNAGPLDKDLFLNYVGLRKKQFFSFQFFKAINFIAILINFGK